MARPSVLELRHLRMTFRSVQALEDVSLQVRTGEIHALLGQKGAGKTTLMKILGGLYPAKAYQGEIIVGEQPVVLSAPHHAAGQGLAIVPRRPSVVPSLSVAENIAMGRWRASRSVMTSRKTVWRQAEETLRELGVTLDLDARASQLGAAQRQLVALARAVGGRPRLIILDEPTAQATAPAEVSQLFRILRLLAGRDIASLYLTQDPGEAMRIADRITVLRDGSTVGAFEPASVDAATLAAAMISNQPDRGAGPEDGADAEDDIDGLGGILGLMRSLGLNSRR